MTRKTGVGRREFILTAAVGSSAIAGCIGTKAEHPGVIDASDVTVKSPKNADFTAKPVNDEGNRGLDLSTNDSIKDGEIVAEIPTSLPEVEKSTMHVNADVDDLDDDAEVEIRFRSQEGGYRSIYIGNEFKAKESGVLATETGSGFSLESPFSELPIQQGAQSTQIQELNRIQFVIREGDFSGTLWQLMFVFEDWSITVL